PKIAPGATMSFGVQANYSGSNDAPTTFPVNGVSCTGTQPANPPPDITPTSPAKWSALLVNGPIELTAAGSAPDASNNRWQFAADNTGTGIDTTSPYRFTWTDAAAGSYSVTAIAYDDQGARTVSAPIAIRVLDRAAVIASPPTVRVPQGGTADFEVRLSN